MNPYKKRVDDYCVTRTRTPDTGGVRNKCENGVTARRCGAHAVVAVRSHSERDIIIIDIYARRRAKSITIV